MLNLTQSGLSLYVSNHHAIDYYSRLIVHLYFPGENANFDLDLELAGIVDCTACTANMLGTKLEVKLKKEELGSWGRLDVPKKKVEKVVIEDTPKDEPQVDVLDLDDMDLTPTKYTLSKEAMTQVN